MTALPNTPHLRFETDGDAPAAIIALPNARARISLIGAHVMSFETKSAKGWRDHLWLSPRARPTRGKAMRGGIPLCWPWFGPHRTQASAPQHGVVRTAQWSVVNETLQTDDQGLAQIVTFSAPDDAIASAPGLSAGAATLSASVLVHDRGWLALNLTTRTAVDMTVSQVFHTYFRVADVRRIAVHGCQNLRYRDQADANAIKILTAPFDFAREVNAHFPELAHPLQLDDPSGHRRIHIAARGATGATVWHPGPDAPSKFPEIPADVAHEFVCIESGNLPEQPLHLKAGDSHSIDVIYTFDAP